MHHNAPSLLHGIGLINASLKPTGERFQRSRIQAVGEHLGTRDMAPFHIEVQLHAAPAETLVDAFVWRPGGSSHQQ